MLSILNFIPIGGHFFTKKYYSKYFVYNITQTLCTATKHLYFYMQTTKTRKIS